MALGLSTPPRVKLEDTGARDGCRKSGLAETQSGGQMGGQKLPWGRYLCYYKC